MGKVCVRAFIGVSMRSCMLASEGGGKLTIKIASYRVNLSPQHGKLQSD